ncbi:MAG: acetyltransferase [Desulfobulbus propionicus]|nr:MAG: acetyltransferase [Desulfobulbus propionicus]
MFDVFNGDADGICALHQLRLRYPQPENHLITGVKRDIVLLANVEARETDITVLDISLDRNRIELERLLAAGNRVFYADHHYGGILPDHPGLTAHIDPQPQTCTSLIINTLLEGAYVSWAVVGAYGDNLNDVAEKTGRRAGLGSSQLVILQELGVLLNYNSYGESLEDLYFPPKNLYQELHQYSDPFIFGRDSTIAESLRRGYADDMAQASAIPPLQHNSSSRVYRLPEKPWARRISGVFANHLAREQPHLAHALINTNSDDSLRISVRAPLRTGTGADSLCRAFPTGGGRAAAAGINRLPGNQLQRFLDVFSHHFASN